MAGKPGCKMTTQALRGAFLARMRKADGVSVTYWHGAQTVTLTATSMPPAPEEDAVDPIVVRARLLDWVVAVADLLIGGVAFTPAEGDTIVRATGSITETWE